MPILYETLILIKWLIRSLGCIIEIDLNNWTYTTEKDHCLRQRLTLIL